MTPDSTVHSKQRAKPYAENLDTVAFTPNVELLLGSQSEVEISDEQSLEAKQDALTNQLLTETLTLATNNLVYNRAGEIVKFRHFSEDNLSMEEAETPPYAPADIEAHTDRFVKKITDQLDFFKSESDQYAQQQYEAISELVRLGNTDPTDDIHAGEIKEIIHKLESRFLALDQHRIARDDVISKLSGFVDEENKDDAKKYVEALIGAEEARAYREAVAQLQDTLLSHEAEGLTEVRSLGPSR